MHFCAGVIQRGNAEEYVVLGLVVVLLFHLAGVHQAAVRVQDRLGKNGGSRGEVDGCIILICQRHAGSDAGAVGGQLVVVLCERRTVTAHIEQNAVLADGFCDGLHSADKLRPEYQNIHICQIHAVLDFLGAVPEVHGNCQCAGFQDAEINGKPLQAVHQENCHLVTLFHATAHQQLCKTIGFFVEHVPCDFTAIPERGGRLNQIVVLPQNPTLLLNLWIDLDKADIIGVFSGVFF